jgi:hypothetical protein
MNNLLDSRIGLELSTSTLSKCITDKIELETGFASETSQIRHLINLLKFYDKSGHGFISFRGFQEFLLRMNCLTMSKTEVEYFFTRFDDNMTEFADCRELAYQIYGLGMFPKLSKENIRILEKIRQTLVTRDIHAAIQLCWSLRNEADDLDNEGNAPTHQVVNIISNSLGHSTTSTEDLKSLLSCFSFGAKAVVNIPLFLKSFKVPFSCDFSVVLSFILQVGGLILDRKQLIRSLFETLDFSRKGFLTVQDIQECYNIYPSASICYRGESISRPSVDSLLQDLLGSNYSLKDRITWSLFSDYYCCLSFGIERNDFFEYIVRHSWHQKQTIPSSVEDENIAVDRLSDSFGSFRSSVSSASSSSSSFTRKDIKTIKRRIIVVHYDGREETVDLSDELGRTKLDKESIIKELSIQGIYDIKSICF